MHNSSTPPSNHYANWNRRVGRPSQRYWPCQVSGCWVPPYTRLQPNTRTFFKSTFTPPGLVAECPLPCSGWVFLSLPACFFSHTHSSSQPQTLPGPVSNGETGKSDLFFNNPPTTIWFCFFFRNRQQVVSDYFKKSDHLAGRERGG